MKNILTLAEINSHPQVLEFIHQTDEVLVTMGYTEHGLNHSTLVADRARTIAREIGLSSREQDLAAISAFCHDMANFISRTNHHYFAALLFHQVFNKEIDAKELAIIMQAIANHDKDEMEFAHSISAILVLADKSDVRRSRVKTKNIEKIKADIHDRVNYATTISKLKIDKKNKKITLILKIDTSFVPVMEYFEIFTGRMVYCRKAAKYLNYDFGLVINNFRLL